ncbi:hypothetical protein [Nonomuraea aridisoli]|uniref:Uncharacterized protein n=1 Tax=Nonomuraea aridisoli TaxID=2070368 RepID=A0A2W2FCH3_9ACTN|nr:hypothetical protein [Nonomuraea aridisoli]PZG19307.1 hypothetical protein C1J01_12695 [Nonomuraea aridisoli]
MRARLTVPGIVLLTAGVAGAVVVPSTAGAATATPTTSTTPARSAALACHPSCTWNSSLYADRKAAELALYHQAQLLRAFNYEILATSVTAVYSMYQASATYR